MNRGPLSFVAIDLETTGLYPHQGDRICEIGAVRIESGREETFHSLVNPGLPMPDKAGSIHGITDRMIETAPSVAEALPQLLEFIQGRLVVAHNVWMEMGFLSAEAVRAGLAPLELGFIDTLFLSRKLFPKLGKHNLSFLRRRFDLSTEDEHRALSDARATAELFLLQVGHLGGDGEGRLDPMERLFRVHGPPTWFASEDRAAMADPELAAVCREAIGGAGAVRLDYLSKKEKGLTRRIVDPWGVVEKRNRLYLSAFCRLRNEHRYFRFDRISDWAASPASGAEEEAPAPAR